MQVKLISVEEVRKKLGISKAAVYQQVARKVLPPSIKMSALTARWPEHELDEIIAARMGAVGSEALQKIVRDIMARRANAHAEILKALGIAPEEAAEGDPQ